MYGVRRFTWTIAQSSNLLSVVVAAMLLAIANLLVPLLQPSLMSSGRYIFVIAVMLSSVPLFVRLTGAKTRRWGWALLLIAELLTALAGALYGGLPNGTNPFSAPTANLVLAILISLSAATGVVIVMSQWYRVLDKVLMVDGLVSGLAIAGLFAWLFLHRIFKVGSREFLTSNHNENMVVGLLLVGMIVVVVSALSLADVIRNYSVPILAAGLFVIAAGEVLAIHAEQKELSNLGATIDACWIVGYLLAGVAASYDRPPSSKETTIGVRTVQLRQARKLTAFGLLAILVIILSYISRDPAIVGGLALGSLATLIIRLLMSLRLERTHSEQFEVLAHTDPLTGLANRRTLAEQIIANGSSSALGAGGGVLLVDLDNFKEVNDALGHRAGDHLLIGLSARLKSLLGEHHLSRIGGDEFAIECASGTVGDLMELANQLKEIIRVPIVIDDLALSVSASIGVAPRTGEDDSPDALIRRADVAMYRAKELKSGTQYYEFEHDRNDPSRLVMYGELSESVKNRTIDVYFQPLIDMADHGIRGCEALARWTSPSAGPVPPDRFIPMIELQGLISPFTAHVLDESVRHTKGLDDLGDERGVSVNVSERDFINADFPNIVSEILQSHRFRPDRLTIEITENVIANDDVATVRTLHRLRDLGVRVSIDDFGTGYSTLSKLMDYPVDELKIDQTFVSKVLTNSIASAIVKASVELAHSMGLNIVAEGIEDQATFQFLEALGVDVAQGYYFARPMPAAECESFLRYYLGSVHEIAEPLKST